MRSLAGAVAVGLVAVPALVPAHVAPAVKDNNRYIKVTPMGNRVRLAYTVFFGEIPGQLARAEMDTDRDGSISSDEADAFGAKLAGDVGSELSIEIDGQAIRMVWDEVNVGLGTPATNAGAFSVDLIAWACPGDGDEHRFEMYDRYQIDRPGETELRVEESPGVRVQRSTLGADGELSQLKHEWLGGESPLATLGYHLTYAVDESEAVMASDSRCRGAGSGRLPMWMHGAIGAGIAVLSGVLVWVVIRRRRR